MGKESVVMEIQITLYADFCTIWCHVLHADGTQSIVPSMKSWKRVSTAERHAAKAKKWFEEQGYTSRIITVDRTNVAL